MKKIVFIAPHLSTGGMPQYLVKQIELIKDDCEVYCVEWGNVTGGVLVVQRNKVVNLLGNRLITLGENKHELFDVINRIQPDVVHLQEIPELFMQGDVADKLYSSDRNYSIIETSHDSGYNTGNKSYLPDKFLMVSQYQANKYERFGIPVDIVEYPIENKTRTKTRIQALRDLGLDPNFKHVINVGLFTPRKNQAEIIEYARILQNYPIQFHFIGNQADNFKFYWEPLMKDFPSNCKWWNERSDVDNFYEAADLFLFTSRGHATDMETMPLVIRESLSWKTPSLIYNLPVYMGYFDTYNTIEYLSDNIQENAYKIAMKLFREEQQVHIKERVFYTMNGEEKLSSFEYLPDTNENAIKYGDAGAQYHATFLLRELERDNFIISKGDVFVDLGGNIGMSSYFANERGAGEIHSFEPDPEMRKLLSKNVPTANIYPYAISDKESELTLYHWPHNPVNLGPTYSVSCITLKDVLRIVGKKINYLKIDIEGFEEKLFDELTPLECSQIEKMMIEYHNVDTLETFCSTLRSKGFDIVHITHGYQAVIYAKYKGKQNMFTCHFEIEEQKIHYSALSNIKDEICVSVRDIDSTAVIWAVTHPELVQHSSFWIMPIPKHILDFTTNTTFGGVLVEFYVKGELVQSNYFRIRQPSIKKPKINLPNIRHPIYFNYKEFFIEKIYDKYLANKKYDTVIDIGANVGVWAEYIQHISTVNKLYLVEPNHEALKVLNSHFTKENITVINKAVSDTNGQMNFFTDENNSLISSLTKYNTLDKFYEVETITFSKLVSDYNIDKVNLLKVDIETGEYALFNSLTSDDFNKIDNILLEFHLLAGRTLENDVNPLIEKLKNNGYNVQFHQEHEHGGYIFANR